MLGLKGLVGLHRTIQLHCIGDRDQDHPQEKEMQKSKMAVWGGLTKSCEKKRNKAKEKRKDISI